MQTLLTIISIITLTAGLISVYYAFTWRRKPGAEGKLLQSRMNIFIGIALLGLGANQFFFVDLVIYRRIFAGVFIIMGLVNLIMGIRNHKYFKNILRDGKK